ncbi:serine/threonine protein phosphatase, partial [Streptomyces sp. PSRA5]
MVEGSMTQGAGTGQGPVVRTATLRDFRVPPYTQVPVRPGRPAPPEQTVAGGGSAPGAVAVATVTPVTPVAFETPDGPPVAERTGVPGG